MKFIVELNVLVICSGIPEYVKHQKMFICLQVCRQLYLNQSSRFSQRRFVAQVSVFIFICMLFSIDQIDLELNNYHYSQCNNYTNFENYKIPCLQNLYKVKISYAMNTQFPAELNYNNLNPKGFFSAFKQWQIQPIGNGGSFWPGQNVKILIQSLFNGVMDPYRSHLQITVQCDINTLPVGLLQVDSSAQSFIEQLVISSRNRQIQRIPQYSVLAAWLTDIGLAQLYAQGRQTQGLGYNNIDSLQYNSKASNTQTSLVTELSQTDNGRTIFRGSGNVFPTQTNSISGSYSIRTGNTQSKNQPLSYQNKIIQGHLTPTNLSWKNDVNQFQWFLDRKNYTTQTKTRQVSVLQTGYIGNIRAQYLSSMQNSRYADSTTSRPFNQIRLNSSLHTKQENGIRKVHTQFAFQKGDEYKPFIPQKTDVQLPWALGTDYKQTEVSNTTNLFGFTSLFSPNFAKGTHQPFISPTVPQCQMKNGKILPTKIPVSRRTFKIPIISAIIGLLIPQDQFVLIPIKALNQLLIQLVLDRYAMFTSGYNDISQTDSIGMTVAQTRAFSVKKLQYKMHTYQFFDAQIDQYVNKSLMNRIMLNCNMWTLGNQYTMKKGDHVSNNWPVACTSQALNEIIVLFVPHDYQKHSFCRKHFRISNNITKFHLRINMEYFPPQPIIGNGGNPCQIEGAEDDNSNFIENIFWSNNFMFNKVNPFPRINAYNFAINDRCYDVNKVDPMYADLVSTITNVNNSGMKWLDSSINSDTAQGMPWIHQNRYVGKAGYVFSFQPYAHSAYHMVGLDCRNIRQFDVIMTSHAQDAFQREQSMFVFTRSAVIVQMTQKGIMVYGR